MRKKGGVHVIRGAGGAGGRHGGGMYGACAVYGCAGVQRICLLLCSCVHARVLVFVCVRASERACAWCGSLCAWPSRRGARVGYGQARDVTRLFGPLWARAGALTGANSDPGRNDRIHAPRA